ncbi:MAG: hypothetical protein R3Y16_02360 [Rikenellaceae bacterium]
MRRRITTIVALIIAAVSTASSQEVQPLKQLHNVELLDLKGKPAVLPKWGEKNLLIFYIDPDRASQNQDFTDELERSKRAESENIFGFGVINLKDAPFVPNGLARMMADKRTRKNGATVLADQRGTLYTEWELGDCNNMFIVMMVNRAGELVFIRKGLMDDDDKAAFFVALETIK